MLSKSLKITLIIFFSAFSVYSYPDSCECGRHYNTPEKGRIYNGEDASPHRYPWQVHIEITTSGAAGDYGDVIACGGTLISRKHILTAK